MKRITVLCVFLVLAITGTAQEDETPAQKLMARQMAEYMDELWEQQPQEGLANIRFLMMSGGEAFSGVTSIHGRFHLKLEGRSTQVTAFNPNANGRYVLQDIDPGDYEVVISGLKEMEGFEWTKELKVDANEKPVVEIDIGG